MKIKFILLLLLMLWIPKESIVQAATKVNCKVELAYHSVNSNVKNLQKELNSVQHCNLAVDGIFGSETYQCVTDFQSQNRLDVDGIVGPKTCNKLNSLYAKEMKKSYVVVLADKLNVRSLAKLDSSIKGVVKQGDVLQVYGRKKVNGVTWYKVWIKQTYVDDHYGYIHGDYVDSNALLLNIDKQQLTYYRTGKVYMQVPVVTGMKGTHDTPVGRFTIEPSDKIAGTTLVGVNDDQSIYRSYVDYWMPFINQRGIGFHDASWRNDSDFNATTYEYNGSHGCVNMRRADAKKLYQSIRNTMNVIVVAK